MLTGWGTQKWTPAFEKLRQRMSSASCVKEHIFASGVNMPVSVIPKGRDYSRRTPLTSALSGYLQAMGRVFRVFLH